MNAQSLSRLPAEIAIWGGFLLIAALSVFSPMTATVGLVAGCLAAIVIWPHYSLGVAVFVLGFKQLFSLEPGQVQLVMVAVLSAITLQTLRDPRTRAIVRHLYHYPLLFLLSFSLVLNGLHQIGTVDRDGIFRLGWHLLAVLAAFRAAALADDSEAVRMLRRSLVTAGILIAAISAIYLYVPMPSLVGNTFVHTELLRLVGVVDDSNSIARWFLPAAIAALLIHNRSCSAWTFALLSACAIVLCAAASKSGLLSFGLAWGLIAFFGGRWRVAVTALLAVAVGGAIWFGVIEQPLKRHASAWWQEAKLSNDTVVFVSYQIYSVNNPNYKKIDKYSSKIIFGDMLTSLRLVGNSVPLEMKPEAVAPQGVTSRTDSLAKTEGARDWTKVREVQKPEKELKDEKSVLESGNRRRLWVAGMQVIRDNPWWGVGIVGWKDEMISRLHFPYLSPHNGFLHVTGSYGILGALLYIAALGRVAWLLFFRRTDMWALCVIACYFGFELFDVSTIFTPTIMTAVTAILIGRIEGLCPPIGHAIDRGGPGNSDSA